MIGKTKMQVKRFQVNFPFHLKPLIIIDRLLLFVNNINITYLLLIILGKYNKHEFSIVIQATPSPPLTL